VQRITVYDHACILLGLLKISVMKFIYIVLFEREKHIMEA